MPFTLSHAAAVLPLRRCCPRRLDFAALVAGSLAPDLAYYLPGFEPPLPTHSLSGGLVLDLPAGLLLLAAFHLFKHPWCALLPQPHRAALAPLAAAPPRRAALPVVLSVLLGVWSHLAWDSCTHVHGWCVERLAWLRAPLWSGAARPFAVFDALQQLSGVAGALALWWVYRRWLRRQPAAPRANDGWRWTLLGAIAAASLACAAPAALEAAAHYRGGLATQVFLFQFWVRGAGLFMVLLSAAGLAVRALNRGAD